MNVHNNARLTFHSRAELVRLQAERRRLEEFERNLDSPAALPGSRLHAVLQEHKRRLDERYRRALKAAHGKALTDR